MTSVENSIFEFIITKIEFQKKDTTRRSVFINGKYSFSVSAEVFKKYPLNIDQILSQKQIDEIQNCEEYEKALQLGLKYLAIRMRSVFEFRTYLLRKGIQEEQIEKVISYCLEKKYLNDNDFCEAFVKDEFNFNKSGVYKIRQKLFSKGIEREIVDEVLSELISKDDQAELAMELGKKKYSQIRNSRNIKQKLFRYLTQKGYSNEISMQTIEQILNS